MEKNRKYLRLKTERNDSNEFIAIIESIVNNFCEMNFTSAITGIKIKNWFDHKWLNYSGKGVVPFMTNTERFDVALDNFWRDKVTIPPFNRKRVISETNYTLPKERKDPMETILHKYRKDNLNNRLKRYSDDAVFFWYSSESKESKKGSLMIYHINKDEVFTFYASFAQKIIWDINKTKNISNNEIRLLMKKS